VEKHVAFVLAERRDRAPGRVRAGYAAVDHAGHLAVPAAGHQRAYLPGELRVRHDQDCVDARSAVEGRD
jgi:hypothetical protein